MVSINYHYMNKKIRTEKKYLTAKWIRSAFQIFICGFALFISSSVHTFELEEVSPPVTFEESVNPEVKVAGHIVVGVMLSGAHKGLTKEALVLSPVKSEKSSKLVCFKVTSRDGSYNSRGSYKIDFSSKKYKQLPYITKYKDLANYKEGELAIIAYTGECSKKSNRYHLPFSVQINNANQSIIENQTLEIFINGFDATDVSYEISVNGNIKSEDCSYIAHGRHTAYNYSCRIDNIEDIEKPMPVSIFRERYGRELPLVTFEIVGLLPN